MRMVRESLSHGSHPVAGLRAAGAVRHAGGMRLAVAISLSLVAACRAPAPRCPAPAAPTIASAPTPAAPTSSLTAERRAWWEAVRAAKAPPAGTAAATLVPELEAMLTATDPAVRDGLGYEMLARWLQAAGALDAATVRGLRDRLVARTAGPIVAGDAVFARSFAALVLSVVTAREVAAPDLDRGRARRADDRRRGLRRTRDRPARLHGRQRLGPRRRAHRRLDEVPGAPSRRSPRDQATRRCSARSPRSSRAITACAGSATARTSAWPRPCAPWRAATCSTTPRSIAWLATVIAPLARRLARAVRSRSLYANQRNARDLLVSCFVALSFDDSPGAARALARLNAAMKA
jgi:hypothetical protein